jgi:hypothetical protein
MFVRKSPSGELIATGSIHHAKLAQLQAAAKKPRKAAHKSEEPATEEPVAGTPETEPAAQPKTVSPFKSALDTKHQE